MSMELHWYSDVRCNANTFSCWQNWWHWLWHSFKQEPRLSCGTWCCHEIWTCSCGKRWQVDLSQHEHHIQLSVKELKEGEG